MKTTQARRMASEAIPRQAMLLQRAPVMGGDGIFSPDSLACETSVIETPSSTVGGDGPLSTLVHEST
jgi:hypothetical protein